MYQVVDRYVCNVTGGCTVCDSPYVLDTNKECYIYVPPPPSNTTNTSTNTTNTTTNTTTNATANTTNTTVNTTTTNTTSNTTNTTTNTTINTTTNTTTPTPTPTPTPNSSVPITPPNILPPPPPPIPISPVNTAAPSNASNTVKIFITDDNICYFYGEMFCEKFCSFKCATCDPLGDEGQCLTCAPKRVMDQYGNCELPMATSFALTALNLAKTFRANSAQFAFYLLDNFQLYQYHRTNYSGVVQEILDETSEVENLKWSLIAFDFVLNWSKKPYSDSEYNYFTNYRFLEVERKDSLMYETTKSYYCVYFPVTILLFFIFNKLFHFLKKYKVSQLLRSYSFWLQLAIVLVVSNAAKFCYLGLSYLQLLFSFSTQYKLLHSLSLLLIGVFIVVLLSFFFVVEYCYGNLCKYMLVNVYRIDFALAYNFIRFSLRPMLEAGMHVFLFYNTKDQLLALGIVQALMLVFLLFLEARKQIFKLKSLFMCDILLVASMLLLDILLYFKHVSYVDDPDVPDAAEDCMEDVCMLMMIVASIVFIIPLIESAVLIFGHGELNEKMERKEKEGKGRGTRYRDNRKNFWKYKRWKDSVEDEYVTSKFLNRNKKRNKVFAKMLSEPISENTNKTRIVNFEEALENPKQSQNVNKDELKRLKTKKDMFQSVKNLRG